MRDNFSCILCGSRSVSNHVHHINNNTQDNRGTNLVTLCQYHHALVTRNKLKLQSLPSELNNEFFVRVDEFLLGLNDI